MKLTLKERVKYHQPAQTLDWVESQNLVNDLWSELQHLGFIANPERMWQGECGHLWRHEGKGEPTCPICAELEQTKADAALVVRAMDAAVQLTEVLLAFYPQNTPMHPSVATAMNSLADAMNAIRRREAEPKP
jgi:hypothetical protein